MHTEYVTCVKTIVGFKLCQFFFILHNDQEKKWFGQCLPFSSTCVKTKK